jgi:cation transport regulator ChaC
VTDDAPVWVFGYGSLVWRPALPWRDRRAARLDGWARRFWQASTDHRGTVDAPGRVLTLVPAPGEALWGVAYAVAPGDWPAVLAALDVREQQGYDRVDAPVALAPGLVAAPPVAEVTAAMYLATSANAHYVGPEPRAATVSVVRGAVGPSGDNATYVRALSDALRALGAPDPEVEAVRALLDAAPSPVE